MTNNEIEQVADTVFSKHVQRGNSHKQLVNIMGTESIKFKDVPSTNDRFVGALTRGINGQYYIFALCFLKRCPRPRGSPPR